MLSNHLLTQMFNAISHEKQAQIINYKQFRLYSVITHFTYPRQILSIYTEHTWCTETNDGSLVHNLLRNWWGSTPRPTDRLTVGRNVTQTVPQHANARQFVSMVTWKCVMIMIILTLTKLLCIGLHRRKLNHVELVPCHYGMARPKIATGG
jgi:hypothetical protein